MKIYFNSSKDEKILTNERMINRYYNSNDAKRIKSRITELISARSLSDIPQTPPPRRHKLTGNYKDSWGVDYSKNCRIIIEPYGEYDIEDLSSIKEIKIIKLEDYH